MTKGQTIHLPGWGRHHAGFDALVLGFGKGTVLIRWLTGPLARREARVVRRNSK